MVVRPAPLVRTHRATPRANPAERSSRPHERQCAPDRARSAARQSDETSQPDHLRRVGSSCGLLALLSLLFRPLGKNRANGVGQTSILLFRSTTQLLPQLRLNKRSNQFTTRAHGVWRGMAGPGAATHARAKMA